MPAVRAAGTDPVVDAARYGAVGPLVDSMLHDVRNPLNAISINLEVLTEKLKLEAGGQVSPKQEKNLKAMREQIVRVDALLRRFAEFLHHRPGEAGVVDLAEGVSGALEVLGYECRRRRIELQTELTPGLRVRLADTGELGFLVVQPLLRAVRRVGGSGQLRITVQALDEGRALLEFVDGAPDAASDGAAGSVEGEAALALACARLGVELEVQGARVRLLFGRA